MANEAGKGRGGGASDTSHLVRKGNLVTTKVLPLSPPPLPPPSPPPPSLTNTYNYHNLQICTTLSTPATANPPSNKRQKPLEINRNRNLNPKPQQPPQSSSSLLLYNILSSGDTKPPFLVLGKDEKKRASFHFRIGVQHPHHYHYHHHHYCYYHYRNHSERKLSFCYPVEAKERKGGDG